MSPHEDSRRHVLIFDFDGVVVHTEEAHFASWNAAFQDYYGVAVDGDYRQVVGLTLAELMEKWTVSGALPQSALQANVQEELLALKTEHFFELGKRLLRPIEGVAELVQEAQQAGWYCAIASRARRMRLLRTLEIARIPAVFELVLSAEDIVDPETDRKNHAIAAHALGAEPADCVVIEDSAGGVLDARNSGIGWVVGLMTSIAAEELLDAGADKCIDNLSEFELRAPAR